MIQADGNKNKVKYKRYNKLKVAAATVLSVLLAACSNDDDVLTVENSGIETIPAEIMQFGNGNSTRVIVGKYSKF